MRARPQLATLVTATLVFAAFAGCLADTSRGDPSISRIHTLTISRATMEAAGENGDDLQAALREILKTDLVIRVQEEGDYALEYVDAQGVNRTREITGASPAAFTTVSGADPIAPATLKRGGEIVSVRAGIDAEWFHAGDMPLGFNLTGASKAVYDFEGRFEESLTLTDLDVAEMEATVSNLAFRLLVPVEGSASWTVEPDTGEGTPVLVEGDIRVAPDAGELVSLDVVATQAGQPGTAGVAGSVEEATASARAKVWFRDGQPAAAQFLGAEYAFAPRATMWADGFFAELASGQSCAGASKADACEPDELEEMRDTEPAGTKETFDASDFPSVDDDDDAREAIALIERLFAQDIVAGDTAILRMEADEDDLAGTGFSGPSGSFLFEFVLEAVETEDVTVPAGTFDAIKILETARTVVDVRDLQDPNGQPLVDAYSLDETIARTTFWLDATTYQPLKMEATTPFNAEEILKGAIDAIDESAWDQIGGKPIEDSQWSVTAVAESSYEAVELQPGARFSALVGLGLAHTLAGSGASPLSMWWLGLGSAMGSGFGSSYTEAVPVPPMRALSLTSSSAAADGVKSYTVSSVSPNTSWGELMITIDGMDSWLELHDACDDPEEGFTVCRGGEPVGYEDVIEAGDEITVRAEPGAELRVLDPYSNSVILVLMVR